MSYAYEYDVKYNMSFEKKEQNEVKIFGCVFSLVIIQKAYQRVMTSISRTCIFR